MNSDLPSSSLVRSLRSLALGALLIFTTGPNAPPSGMRTFCVEGAKYTCFGIQVLTSPSASGTDVTVRVQNLQGSTVPNVPAQVDWARIYGIHIIGAKPAFGGGPITTADPTLVADDNVVAFGDMREAWFSFNVGDDEGTYYGYGLETPYKQGGAELVGCGSPSDLNYPYLRTCDAAQSRFAEFRFSTEGQWDAAQVGIVVAIHDTYAEDMTCLIPGTLYDDPDAYHCMDPTLPPPPDNTAPVLSSVGGPYSGFEGTAVLLSLSASDADGDALTYEWDVGADGSVENTTLTPSASFTFPDNGNRSIKVTVRDGHGGSTEGTASVSVANVPPTVGALSAPAAPIPQAATGNTVALGTSFTDPGTGDTFTASVFCDGGTPGSATASAANGAGSANATCTFAQAGVYNVHLTVNDDDGGQTTTEHRYVVVYDPNSGFVTGGGWILSPTGAFVDQPALIGKATFGFVSKYQKGQSKPSGNTEFEFHAGGFAFSSAEYEWLVVSGSLAQFKGTGMVNGSVGYGFLLTARDGDANGGGGVDKFRIKIWELTTGRIVYDNVSGASDYPDQASPQVLGGGSISIKNR